MVDFSKAFDTVNHVVLIRKLCLLGLPANIFNWIISFLTERALSTVSLMVYILQREILTYRLCRGRELAHCLCVVMESYLNPLSRSNILIKYADDTNLLVPEHTESTLTEEFTHNL